MGDYTQTPLEDSALTQRIKALEAEVSRLQATVTALMQGVVWAPHPYYPPYPDYPPYPTYYYSPYLPTYTVPMFNPPLSCGCGQ